MNGSTVTYEENLDDLTRRYYGILMRVARRITRDIEDAKDAIQEALLSVFEKKGTCPQNIYLKTYLYRAVVNKCIDANRRKNRWRSFLLFTRPEEIVWQYHDRDSEESLAPAVNALLNRLPDALRIPFVLAECEELPYREIADILDIPINTVRTRIFRAREKLRSSAVQRGLLP